MHLYSFTLTHTHTHTHTHKCTSAHARTHTHTHTHTLYHYPPSPPPQHTCSLPHTHKRSHAMHARTKRVSFWLTHVHLVRQSCSSHHLFVQNMFFVADCLTLWTAESSCYGSASGRHRIKLLIQFSRFNSCALDSTLVQTRLSLSQLCVRSKR